MSDLLLPDISGMSCEGMVERGAVDILRMGGQVVADRCGKIDILAVGHRLPPDIAAMTWLPQRILLEFLRCMAEYRMLLTIGRHRKNSSDGILMSVCGKSRIARDQMIGNSAIRQISFENRQDRAYGLPQG